MTPSAELLAIRERCAAEWEPGSWFHDVYSNGGMSYEAWSFLEPLVDWPFCWICDIAKTRLEVVEMIERAAVAALRDEGVM